MAFKILALTGLAPVAAIVLHTNAGYNFGSSKCPCVGFSGLEGSTTVQLNATVSTEYPANFAAYCEAWDNGRNNVSCQEGQTPGKDQGWCAEAWCYVDPCNCELDEPATKVPEEGGYMPHASYQGRGMWYSYKTCGGKDYWMTPEKKKELQAVPKNCSKKVDEKKWGSEKCRCIGYNGAPGQTNVSINGAEVPYPAEAGASCEAWDAKNHPDCLGDKPAAWCKMSWCYVDPCECQLEVPPKTSAYLPKARGNGKPIYFSYAACGAEDEYTKGNEEAASVFEKSADAQIIPRGQYVSEGEAANLSSLTSWGLSLHVGFHSHIEIISHLLHLCVQMALFPRPEQTETSVQANSRSVFSSHQGVQVGSNGRPRDRAVQHPSRNYQVPGWRPVVDASTETRPKGGPPAWRRSIKDSQIKRPRNAIVRIGGGWHVLRNDPEPSEKTESAAGTALAVRTSSPASSPSRSRSPDPERHPFAHGAPSRDTPIERFTFGAYASGSSFGHTYASKDPEKVAREAPTLPVMDLHVDRGKLRHYGLFRVLKPREPLDSPTLALSNGSNGGGTPRSLRTPSPSPRRRAESSELVDVEEVDEDEEEIPGITVFAPNAMEVPTHTRPVRPRARPSSAPRDFQRGSPMEPGQLPQRPSSASSIQRRY